MPFPWEPVFCPWGFDSLLRDPLILRQVPLCANSNNEDFKENESLLPIASIQIKVVLRLLPALPSVTLQLYPEHRGGLFACGSHLTLK